MDNTVVQDKFSDDVASPEVNEEDTAETKPMRKVPTDHVTKIDPVIVPESKAITERLIDTVSENAQAPVTLKTTPTVLDVKTEPGTLSDIDKVRTITPVPDQVIGD